MAPDSHDGDRRLGRRGFLAGTALTGGAVLAGGAGLAGLDTAAGAPATDQLFRTQRWSTFRSILAVDDGYLLTGIGTNGEGEQVGWGVRLDEELDVVWDRAYLSPRHLESADAGEDHDGIEFAVPLGDGGFLLVGWWHTLGSDSRFAWLTRIGDDGIPWWSRVFRRENVSSFRDDFADGVPTDDGALLVGRTIASEFLDRRNGDGWIAEISGHPRWGADWQRAYDPAGTSDGFVDDGRHAEFHAVTAVDDGYLVVGECSPDGPSESTNTAAWALRIDADGEPEWSRTYRLDRGRDNQFRDVAAVDDGFLVAGVAGRDDSVTELHDYEMRGQSWAAKLDGRGRLRWQDSPGGTGLHAVEPTDAGGVFVGRGDGRGRVVAYDADGGRLGSHGSEVGGSDYTAVTTRDGSSPREYLPVGYGRGGGSTSGLLSRVTDADFGDDGDEEERLFEIVATEHGSVRYELTVDGDAEGARVTDRVKAEDDDEITQNDDGTVTVTGTTGNPGYGDAFRFTGEVLEFGSSGDIDFFLRLDRQRVTVDELLDGDTGPGRIFEIVATEHGTVRYEFTVDGDAEGVRLSDRIKSEEEDRVRETDDGTVTVAGSTGNEGYGDAFRVTGEITAFESTGTADFYLRLDGERVSVEELGE